MTEIALPRALGLRYTDFLAALHAEILFDWYLEIGSRLGDSFAPVRGKTIAVDPYFRLRGDVMNVKPLLLLCQQTSDDFFNGNLLQGLGARLSFSFLDGLHIFEYLLRDFINTEANCRTDAIIAIHDCCPFNLQMTTRDLDNLPKGAWTGDVWKMLPVLQEYRPDLTVQVLDAAPTGLVLVSGLDPESRVLRDNYDEILAKYVGMGLADFGIERFAGLFSYEGTAEMIEAGFPLFRPLALDPALVLQPALVST